MAFQFVLTLGKEKKEGKKIVANKTNWQCFNHLKVKQIVPIKHTVQSQQFKYTVLIVWTPKERPTKNPYLTIKLYMYNVQQSHH